MTDPSNKPFVLLRNGRIRTVLVTATIASALAACVVVAPLKSAAFGFIEIFEPRTIAFVPVTRADLESLSKMPDLSDYGEGGTIRDMQTARVTSERAAASLVRFPLREPSIAPAALEAPQFMVTSGSVERFTFDAAKTRMSARRSRRPIPALPPGFDGSTLELDIAPIVVTSFATSGEAATANGATPSMNGGVIVAQTPIPRLSSTGISARELERFLLDQPGVSPRLAALFAALGDPRTTLPLPIPIDERYTQPVIVDGVSGLGIGDNTGLFAAVVWERNGIVYAVGGAKKASDILAIANSLR